MNERPEQRVDEFVPPNSKPTSPQQKRKKPQYNLEISLIKIISEIGKPHIIHIQLLKICSRGSFAWISKKSE